MNLPPPPMVQYLREPGGPVHLRASRSLFTLCHVMPSDEWKLAATDSNPLCPECRKRLVAFVHEIMGDGDKNPHERREDYHNG